jgi:hypothetical protein
LSNLSGTDLTLAWPNVAGATNYNIYTSTVSGGPYTFSTSASSGAGTQISSLVSGTKYYFVVTSMIGNIESTYSPEGVGIPLATPVSPSVLANASGTAFVVTWPAVAGAVSFDLQRAEGAETFSTIATGIMATTYTDTPPSNTLPYAYRYLPYF